MADIKLNLNPVAEDIKQQLQALVPVRTGRLQKGISYLIREEQDGYVILLVMEDYFKYLKPKTKTSKPPTATELAMASPPLPKMNTLGVVPKTELSPRSQSIIGKININTAMQKMDKEELKKTLKKLINL